MLRVLPFRIWVSGMRQLELRLQPSSPFVVVHQSRMRACARKNERKWISPHRAGRRTLSEVESPRRPNPINLLSSRARCNISSLMRSLEAGKIVQHPDATYGIRQGGETSSVPASHLRFVSAPTIWGRNLLPKVVLGYVRREKCGWTNGPAVWELKPFHQGVGTLLM